jgi:hypothetical protein
MKGDAHEATRRAFDFCWIDRECSGATFALASGPSTRPSALRIMRRHNGEETLYGHLDLAGEVRFTPAR